MISSRLRESNFAEPYYRCKEQVYHDLIRMIRNCQQFNDVNSEYYSTSILFENEINELFPDVHMYMQQYGANIAAMHNNSGNDNNTDNSNNNSGEILGEQTVNVNLSSVEQK
jgi:hypothetical protein